MKKFLTLLILLLSFHSIVEAKADDSCNQIVREFLKKGPTLEIPKESILGKNSEILKKMDSLQLASINYSEIYQNFVLRNDRAPTLREMLAQSYVIKEDIINNYDILIYDLKGLPNSNSDEMKVFIQAVESGRSKVSHFKSLDQLEAEVQSSFQHGKTNISSLNTLVTLDPENSRNIDETLYQFLKGKNSISGFQGEYAELLALGASKEKILTRGLTFKVDPKVREVAQRFNKMSDQEIINFLDVHREGLFRVAYHALVQDNYSMARRSYIIDQMMSIIKSKEMDLVTQDANGKIIWSEVKGYLKPISVDVLTHGQGHSKTVFDQLKEHKELRDILGLKDSVRLRFISPISIVEDDAKKLIESIGYEVISAK